MEALSFMKLWLTNANGNKPRREIITSDSTATGDPELYLHEEEDDSFFELEISLSDFSLNKNKTQEGKEEKQTTTFSVSKSKVLPLVETTSKPQSPITSLNSDQKLGAFSIKKENNDRSLNARFRIEDETNSVSSTSSSKRFFDLVKPLYSKTTKKQSVNSASSSPASSPAAREKQRSNVPSGIRSVKRQLGKSRSASAAVGAMSPGKRLDESLQVQQDEIRSAILHCKKSFHGSRESSMLSRSTSESSSHEKLSTSSSEGN
ncbi:membrane-associated kinase regulator 5 isoform X2 [Raphanus sativus]|uniref:Membrane-associated kinase regulator 5 isoform X2 n=1 Tax=Raphanus sativus TaxID=3726 RepID=A0A6J0MAJ9_RAPSA|nr:membrane-associated kinase regulator 5 isoform X2 [Raphanus sativus]